MLLLKHLLHARLDNAKILLVRMKPFLIGVFERCRQRRHDLATVAEITPNFGPFLALAHSLETTSGLNGLFEFVQIQRPFINAWESSKAVAMLLVEFGKLVQIVEVGT